MDVTVKGCVQLYGDSNYIESLYETHKDFLVEMYRSNTNFDLSFLLSDELKPALGTDDIIYNSDYWDGDDCDETSLLLYFEHTQEGFNEPFLIEDDLVLISQSHPNLKVSVTFQISTDNIEFTYKNSERIEV